jgi:hypothetical protein
MNDEKDTNEGKEPVTIEPADGDAPAGDDARRPDDRRADRNQSGGMARKAARSIKRYVN